jgi:hypothetical protein
MRLNCAYSQRRELDEVTLRAAYTTAGQGCIGWPEPARTWQILCVCPITSFGHTSTPECLFDPDQTVLGMGLGNALHQHVGLGGNFRNADEFCTKLKNDSQ